MSTDQYFIPTHFEVEIQCSIDLDKARYAEFLKLGQWSVDSEFRWEHTEPYRGPTPHFALWGATGRYVQIGGREDRWWQRRMRCSSSKIALHIPHARFSLESPE